jgi:hypothetical protein
MLTKEDQERIRQEEIFRQEVRESLQEAKRPYAVGGRIWAIVNTSFGIWLLSTIVVGLFSWAYTNWEQRRSKQHEQNELIRKLDVEIPVRLQTSESLFDSASRAAGYYSAMRSLRVPPDAIIVFPEFRDRPITALLSELLQQVPAAEKAEINEALRTLQRLTNFDYVSRLGDMNGDAPLTPEMQVDVKESKESLKQVRNLNRWRSLD